jgi:hypothetical protein
MEHREEVEALVKHLIETGYEGPGDLNLIAGDLGLNVPHKMDPRTTREIAGVSTDGNCPKCGGELEEKDTSIEPLSDDTAFPTITAEFSCSVCDHVIEVEYDAVSVDLYDGD